MAATPGVGPLLGPNGPHEAAPDRFVGPPELPPEPPPEAQGVDWSKYVLPAALGAGGLYALHRYMSQPDEEEEEEKRRKYGGLMDAARRVGRAFRPRPAAGPGLGTMLGRGAKNTAMGGALVGGGTMIGGLANEGIKAWGDKNVADIRGQGVDKQLAAAEARPEFAGKKGPAIDVNSDRVVGPPDLPPESFLDRAGRGLESAWGSIKPHLGQAGEWMDQNRWLSAGIAGAGGLGLMGLMNQGDDEDEEEKRGQHGFQDDPSVPPQLLGALAKLTALAGGGLGAGMAPHGHRMEGAARGLTAGLGTGVGGGLGAMGGMAIADRFSGDHTGLGALLGAGLGAGGGHMLANGLMGAPSWEDEKRGNGPEMSPGLLAALAAAGPAAGGAFGLMDSLPGYRGDATARGALVGAGAGTGGMIGGGLGAMLGRSLGGEQGQSLGMLAGGGLGAGVGAGLSGMALGPDAFARDVDREFAPEYAELDEEYGHSRKRGAAARTPFFTRRPVV